MSITSFEEASKAISGWLEENGHEVKVIEDDKSNFHFETRLSTWYGKKPENIESKGLPRLMRIAKRRVNS